MLFSLAVIQFALAACALAADGPIVNLGYAQYQGAVDTTTNIASFLGLRYAAAPLGTQHFSTYNSSDCPLGDLRFRAPQPPANVSGVQPAVTQPQGCPQAASGISSTNPLLRSRAGSTEPEDCLFLKFVVPITNFFRLTGIT